MTDTRELVKEVREGLRSGKFTRHDAINKLCDAVEQLEGERETNVLVLGHVKTERAELTAECDQLREANAKMREALGGAQGNFSRVSMMTNEQQTYTLAISSMGHCRAALTEADMLAALKPVDTGGETPWFKCSTPCLYESCEKKHACLCVTTDGLCTYGMPIQNVLKLTVRAKGGES